jgi:hypothetical protein
MENKQGKIYKPLSTPLSLTGRVCDSIKGFILNGKYDQNQRLNEVEIAAALGISRGSIREAIQSPGFRFRPYPGRGMDCFCDLQGKRKKRMIIRSFNNTIK